MTKQPLQDGFDGICPATARSTPLIEHHAQHRAATTAYRE
jgi:hypothetical protein